MEVGDEFFQKMLAAYNQPVVQDYLHHVKSVAGFALPPSIDARFKAFHSHCFDAPRPEFFEVWGTESAIWRWQKLHSESLSDSGSAMAAVLYHAQNLLRLEREVLAFPRLEQLTSTIGNMGGGDTRKLDFEYHGFVFAYRRMLDYLTQSISALLKQNFHSFRKLPQFLAAHSQHPWVDQIIAVHSKYAPRLKSFLSSSEGKSVRDRIAHYNHVPAGCLNVNTLGIFFAGGGEEVDHTRSISQVINDYVQMMFDVMEECLSAMTGGLPKVFSVKVTSDQRLLDPPMR